MYFFIYIYIITCTYGDKIEQDLSSEFLQLLGYSKNIEEIYDNVIQ